MISRIRYNLVLLLIATVSLAVSCQDQSEVNYNGKKKRHHRQPPPNGANQFGNGGQGFGNGGVAGGEVGADGKPVEYPTSAYKGNGSMDVGKSVSLTSDLSVTLDAAQVTLNTTQFRADDDDADDEMRKLVGNTVYRRTEKKKLSELERTQKFNNAASVMFGNGATRKNGNGTVKYDFITPLPILPVPAAASRYKDLTAMSFESDVSQSTGLRYRVSVTVTKVSNVGDQVDIQFLVTIPQDRRGELYSQFPMPRRTIFSIDTKTKTIKKMNIQSDFEHDDERRQMYLIHNLCSEEKSGKVQKYGC